MRLSSKGEYGLLALVDLAMHAGEEPVQVAQIAERQGIPKQYLDQLLISLKRAGLVASSRGRQGGYWLAKLPEKISLLDSVRALEGPVVNDNFLGKSTRRKHLCHAALRRVWERLTELSLEVLREKSLQDLASECKPVEGAVMYYI